jgi:multidrug efflux pump subunit AcrA (membrane-fusion protein)
MLRGELLGSFEEERTLLGEEQRLPGIEDELSRYALGLRQSQFIRARVIWGTERSPVVPILSVSRIGGQYFVFVAEPDKNGTYVARQRPLKLGQIAGNDYVVLDGIKPGDKVVVSGTQFLVDGAPIAPQETSG